MSSNRKPLAHDRITVAYALLRSHPDLNLEAFAASMDTTVAEAADLLDQLVDLSLVRRDDRSDQFLVAVHPVLAVQQIIAYERDAIEARRLSLDKSFEMLSGVMADIPDTIAPAISMSLQSPSAERIEGIEAVRRRLPKLASQARQEVLSFAPTAHNPTAARAASRSPDLQVLARGVVTRTIYLDSIVADAAAMAYAAELVDAGAHIRLVPSLPIRLIIVDRTVAAVPIDPLDNTAGALLLHDIGTVSALVALFEAYWRDGRPVPGNADSAEFSAMDISILRHLASGAKDEAVARQLGVSVRTVRRGIADLMERLRADSRFELGIRAAARGLLD